MASNNFFSFKIFFENYKDQIKDLLERLKKGEVTGVGNIELYKPAEELKEATAEAVSDVEEKHDEFKNSIKTPQNDQHNLIETKEDLYRNEYFKDDRFDDSYFYLNEKYSNLYKTDIGEYLILLSKFSSIAAIGSIAVLSSNIELEMKELLAGLDIENSYKSQMDKRFKPSGPKYKIRQISKAVDLPRSIIESTDLFFDVRNKLLHAKETDYEHEALISIVISGTGILSSLRTIPRIIAKVYAIDITLFKNEELYEFFEDYKGIILEQRHSHYDYNNKIIYPTKNKYKVGDQVTLDYNNKLTIPKAYFRNPDNNEIEIAWDLASEFIGRNIKDM